VPPRSPGPPRGLLRPRAPAGQHEHARVAPADDLAPFIAHFWWVRWDLRGQPAFVAETLPHPTVHLVFEGARAQVAGVPTGAFRKRLAGEGRVFGIKFRPAAFHPWLGAALSTITDRVLPLRGVLGADTVALAHTIRAHATLAPCVAAAEHYLRAHLPVLPADTAAIRDLVERMAVDPTITRAETAAELAGVELRTLQRRFTRLVGVGPKWVIQRYRLHEAAAQLTRGDAPSLAALAAALGYFDQAHFTRDFTAVVGASPGTYVARHRRG
jgi:AraC-like DNA-binding protein